MRTKIAVVASLAVFAAATAAAINSAPFAVPGQPTLTSCTANEHYTLSWAPVAGATHYNLWRADNSSTVKVGTVLANKLSAVFVIPCGIFDIGVSAANGEGDGPISFQTVSNVG